jgi:hypothetical protein
VAANSSVYPFILVNYAAGVKSPLRVHASLPRKCMTSDSDREADMFWSSFHTSVDVVSVATCANTSLEMVEELR